MRFEMDATFCSVDFFEFRPITDVTVTLTLIWQQQNSSCRLRMRSTACVLMNVVRAHAGSLLIVNRNSAFAHAKSVVETIVSAVVILLLASHYRIRQPDGGCADCRPIYGALTEWCLGPRGM